MNVRLMESKRGRPARTYKAIPSAVKMRYISIAFLRVFLMFGFIFSSLASDLYNLNAEVPGFIRMAIKIITTPSPPIHCSKLLKNSIDIGKDSTSLNSVSPLPVHAEMFSKKASMNEMSKTSIIIIAATNPAHSQDMLEMSIPCLFLSLLNFLYFLANKKPNPIEIKGGINPIG